MTAALRASAFSPSSSMPDIDGEAHEDQERDDRFVQSLARGLAVIEAFRPTRERLTMAQVASICGLTRAGARRILLTLNQLGYVSLEGRYFQLTPRILELGAGHLKQSLWETAQPILEQAAVVLNESVSAGELEALDVVYRARARPPKLIHVALAPGAHLPAFASAMGNVLLAALPEPELERYLAVAKFPALTPFTITGRDALRHRLDEVRRQGWICVRGEIDERFACVALPVVDRSGATLAAVNVGMPITRADDEFIRKTVVPGLQDAAGAISAAL